MCIFNEFETKKDKDWERLQSEEEMLGKKDKEYE